MTGCMREYGERIFWRKLVNFERNSAISASFHRRCPAPMLALA